MGNPVYFELVTPQPAKDTKESYHASCSDIHDSQEGEQTRHPLVEASVKKV